MPIYDNDGTANHEIGVLYDNDGTANWQTGKVYDNDGTANHLIYAAAETRYLSNLNNLYGNRLVAGTAEGNNYNAIEVWTGSVAGIFHSCDGRGDAFFLPVIDFSGYSAVHFQIAHSYGSSSDSTFVAGASSHAGWVHGAPYQVQVPARYIGNNPLDGTYSFSLAGNNLTAGYLGFQCLRCSGVLKWVQLVA